MLSCSSDHTQQLAEITGLVRAVLAESLKGTELSVALETAAFGQGAFVGTTWTFLALWTCLAAGGNPQPGLVVSAAWHLLHRAATLLDDIQDGDLEHTAQTLNVAIALIFLSQATLGVLCCLDVKNSVLVHLRRAIDSAVLRVCAGQHQDLSKTVCSLDDYWKTAAAKSGEFFALACRLGAMLGTQDSDLINAFAEFGHSLGILVQIQDDWRGIWDPVGRSDLANGARTLPIAYALSVASPETRQELVELLKKASSACASGESDDEPVTRAKQIITSLGALQYMIIEASLYRHRAEVALSSTGDSNPSHRRLRFALDQAMPMLQSR